MFALTGTPGTGKSTISKILRKRGISVLDLNRWIRKNYPHKENEKCIEVDLKKLNRIASCHSAFSTLHAPLIIEGHLSHHLKLVDKIIVLRCAPTELLKRLKKKKYSQKKIKDNLLVEALDIILHESLVTGKTVFEIDTTKKSVSKVAEEIKKIVTGKKKVNKVYGQNNYLLELDRLFKCKL